MTRAFIRAALVAASLAMVGCAVGDDPEVLGGDTVQNAAERKDAAVEDASTTSTAEEAAPQEFTVESGFTSGVSSIGTRHVSAGALVTNPNPDLAGYDVEVLFNLLGADGTVVDTDSANVPYIPPRSTVPVVPFQIGFDLPDEPADMQVIVTGDLEPDEGWGGVAFSMNDGVDLEITGAQVAAGRFGPELTAQVTNPSDQVVEFTTWDCVFKSGGVVVGGDGSGISDRVPPGATVALNAPLDVDVPADEIVCRGYA